MSNEQPPTANFQEKIRGIWREGAAKYYETNKSAIAERRRERRLAAKEGRVLPRRPLKQPPPPPAPATERYIMRKKKGGERVPLRRIWDLPACLEELKNIPNESTRNTVMKNVRNLFRITGSNDILKTLMEPERVKEAIINAPMITDPTEKYALNSQIGFLQGVENLFNYIPFDAPPDLQDRYKAMWKSMKLQSDDAQKQKIRLRIGKYSDFLQKMKENYGEQSRQYLLAKMYDEFPCRDDYKDIIVSRSELSTNKNYINIANPDAVEITLNHYKTADKYNQIKYTFTKETSNLIMHYINTHRLKTIDDIDHEGKKEEVLFKGSQSNNLQKMLDSVGMWEKGAGSINAVRHMKASEVHNDPASTIEDKIELARRMGHSMVMAYDYLRNPQDYN